MNPEMFICKFKSALDNLDPIQRKIVEKLLSLSKQGEEILEYKPEYTSNSGDYEIEVTIPIDLEITHYFPGTNGSHFQPPDPEEIEYDVAMYVSNTINEKKQKIDAPEWLYELAYDQLEELAKEMSK